MNKPIVAKPRLNLSLRELICFKFCLSNKTGLNQYEYYENMINEKLSVDYILGKLVEIEKLKERIALQPSNTLPNKVELKNIHAPENNKNASELMFIKN